MPLCRYTVAYGTNRLPLYKKNVYNEVYIFYCIPLYRMALSTMLFHTAKIDA